MSGTLTFLKSALLPLIAHSEAAPEWRGDYGSPPPKAPGLTLVGDNGVYLMSAGIPGLPAPGRPADSTAQHVVYAREANPDKMDWDEAYDAKRRIWGGDDGSAFLPLSDLRAALDDGSPTLKIRVTPTSISVTSLAPLPTRKPGRLGNTVHDFRQGDRVDWSRRDGSATPAYVLSRGRKYIAVQPLDGSEARRVHPVALTKVEWTDADRLRRAALDAKRPSVRAFRVGQKVEFTDKKGKTVQGIVTKINRKTVGVHVAPFADWRIPPSMLREVA